MQKYNPQQFEIIGSSIQLGKPIKDFVEKDAGEPVMENAFCLIGEQCEEEVASRLLKGGCVSLLDLIEEQA